MTHPYATFITGLASRHIPNTPRTHNAAGKKVDDPLQCQGCLEAWPCEKKQLLNIIDDLLVQDS